MNGDKKRNENNFDDQFDSRFNSQFDDQGRMRILDGMRYYKKTDTENNMPRFIVTMDETIDPVCLQYAAERAMARFRVHSFKVVHDEARLYLKHNPAKPVIHQDDGKQHIVCTEENNGHMTWIGYDGNSIHVDYFHGVSDGHGTFPFLKTLLHYYCEKKYSAATEDTPEDAREYADSMLFLPEEEVHPVDPYTCDHAFKIPGKQMDSLISSKRFLLEVDAEKLEIFMRANGTSRASIFTQFTNLAIANCHLMNGAPIVAAMAVDARSAYGAEKTMQCCVATIPVWLDEDLLSLPLPEQLRRTRQMIVNGARRENILSSAQKMRKLNQMLEQRFPSLAEKRAFCIAKNEEGSSRYTYGISVFSEITFEEAVANHVTEVSAMICANTLPLIVSVVKYKDVYRINYCTHLEKDPYIKKLQELFCANDIPCICKQMPDMIETHCAF